MTKDELQKDKDTQATQTIKKEKQLQLIQISFTNSLNSPNMNTNEKGPKIGLKKIQ